MVCVVCFYDCFDICVMLVIVEDGVVMCIVGDLGMLFM